MKSFFALVFLIAGVASAAGQTPAAVEKELIGYLNNISKYGSYAGGYDGDKLDKNNAALRNALNKYGKRSDILNYRFAKLENKMTIATSRDRRLRIYSWDLQDGGTMHDFDNVFQYRGSSGRVYTWSREKDTEGDYGAFYTQIFQADTASGPIYIGASTFIGSTSLRSQSISTFKINGEKFDPQPKLIRTRSGLKDSISFEYDFFSVLDSPGRADRLVTYDESRKSFRFPIVVEDSKTPQGRVTNRFITYRFDGKHFVKVS